MPSLPKHDPLKHILATVDDIETARKLYEYLVPTSVGVIQFDADSRQRMSDVLSALEPGDPASVVDWMLADNTQVTLTFEQLRDLMIEAAGKVGQRSLVAFNQARQLKTRLSAGERLTLRDIGPDDWPNTN